MESPYLFAFTPQCQIPQGGLGSKQMVQHIFRQQVFQCNEFQVLDEETGRVQEPLGTHSIQKFSAMYMRQCGCTKDEVDIRGRWKGKGRMSDIYADVELPFPDAKVAAKLCLGGACFYVYDVSICEDTAMMDRFILSYVVPNVRKRLPDSAAVVLGKAVLRMLFHLNLTIFAFHMNT